MLILSHKMRYGSPDWLKHRGKGPIHPKRAGEVGNRRAQQCSHLARRTMSRRSRTAGKRGISDAERPTGRPAPSVRIRGARRFSRRSARSRTSERVPPTSGTPLPPDSLRQDADLRPTGGQGRLAASGQGRRPPDGRQPGAADRPLPSGRLGRRAARRLLRSRRHTNEAAATGPRGRPKHQTRVSLAGVRDQGPGARICNHQSSIINLQSAILFLSLMPTLFPLR